MGVLGAIYDLGTDRLLRIDATDGKLGATFGAAGEVKMPLSGAWTRRVAVQSRRADPARELRQLRGAIDLRDAHLGLTRAYRFGDRARRGAVVI